MKTEHKWSWPIAGYLFLGGLGGGSIIISSASDIFFGFGDVFALGSLLTTITLGLGSSLLIFELGRPLQFWRVFSTQKAIMTFGAWILSLLIATSFMYFSFWPEFSPWHELVILRKILATLNLLLGIGVCAYTGILLGSMRARRFWNSPIVPVLFLVSGVSTGLASHSLLAGLWPFTGSNEIVEMLHALLPTIDLVMIALEFFIIILYLFMMRFFSDEVSQKVAQSWLSGTKSVAFWGGMVGTGLIIPALLYSLSSNIGLVLAPILVLIGGLVLRFLVVYSDERTLIPGETKFYERLPEGNEAFLKILK
ncbi:MAG: polysulfide reductase NrfD [Anaerolineaceae bacterium]|nr:polysulfide reductase NrfD [Anaerolineaceae bacterium]